MKKLIAGIIAAFLLSAGFVAVSTETASAACTKSRYVPCPKTVTKASGPKTVKRGKAPKTKVTVKAAGSIKPKGTVRVSYKGPGVKKSISKRYNGKTLSFTGPKFKKRGTYTISVSFKGTKDFKDSKAKPYKVKVKK